MPASSSKKSKTSRFPVARIKKIMQTDEEVGKLASATPVMISKSLECFMGLLLEEACRETRNRGSKKMTAYHIKQTILSRPTLDFLLPLTSSIPDPAVPDDKPKSSSTRKGTTDSTGIGRKRTKKEPGEPGEGEYHPETSFANVANPNYLPNIGTWKKEAEGGGGSGEGGRGMFDDYEDDEDDY